MPKFYDLTQPLYHDCPGWPTYPPVSVTRNFRRAVDGFNAETVTFNTHSATHIDVPFHFYDEGDTIDKFPLDSFTGDGVFLDLRKIVTADTAINAAILSPFKDRIKPGDYVLLNTGWSEKRAITEEYFFHWPYLDGSGAELLLSLGVKGVGIDGLSVGGWGPEKARPCHLALLGKKVILIEEVRFPEEVMDGKNHYVMAFPLLLKGCGGCPVRLVAVDF
jgi:kynurenine formamidase